MNMLTKQLKRSLYLDDIVLEKIKYFSILVLY
jgi:hypothetical protein